jgi:thiol-disulfide isomerase/thioredoxin
MKIQWKKWFWGLGVTIVALGVIAVGYRYLRSTTVQNAGDLSIQSSLLAAPVGLESGRQLVPGDLEGKYVLVHFWATWCAPCEEELPLLVEFASKVPEAMVLAVSLDKSWTDANLMLKALKRPANWLDVLSPDLKLPEALGSYQFPETYLYDPQGQLAAKWVGPQPWASPGFIRIFTEQVSKK